MASFLRPVATQVGRALRETGQALDRVGSAMMGNYAYKEQLSRHRRIMPLGDARPVIGADAFVAPNSSVIGNVKLGDRTAVWYGAVLRADLSEIHVGDETSIGDRTVISGRGTVTIGARVSVGAGVAVQGGATLQDECVVGAHAVLNGPCTVERNAIVAPGAVVASGTVVGAGQVWSGVPAKCERTLSAAEVESIARLASNNLELARKHAAEHAKDEAARQKERDFKEFHKTKESMYRETPF